MRARGLRVRNWRVVTAIAAVVLAALAGLLVFKYTQDQKNEAKKPFKFVNVLVVQSRVPKQTSFESALETGLIARKDVVRTDVPDSAIPGETTDQALKSTYSGRVASHDLVAGQAVVTSDFVTEGSIQSGLSGQLATDEPKVGKNNAQAITINLDLTHAVGGFLTVGDRVNVIATVDITDPTIKGGGGQKVTTTAFLLPGLKVLTVGPDTGAPTATQAATASSSSSSKNGSTTPTTTSTSVSTTRGQVTLEVTPRQALQLAQAINKGSLYLTLNSATFKAGDFRDDEEIAEAANLFDQPLTLTNQMLQQIKDAQGK
jgi:Flp pilus assembly protein CpaB